MGGGGGVGVAGRFWGGGGGLAQKEKSPDFRCPEAGISVHGESMDNSWNHTMNANDA